MATGCLSQVNVFPTWELTGGQWNEVLFIQGVPDMLPGMPGPFRLTPLRAGDTDLRSSVWNLPPGDVLASVEAVDVKRRDGTELTPNDLAAATMQQPDVEGTAVVIWLTSSVELISRGSIDYQVSVTVSTLQGRTLIRDFFVQVVAPLGPPVTASTRQSLPRAPRQLTHQRYLTYQPS